jgi:two-component system OmpR family response regulator
MIHCLLVDDDEAIRTSLGHYLRGFGMAVTLAEGAVAMRGLLAQSRFDIILLDLMLPDGDGLELCQSVVGTSATPVILLTAKGDVGSRVLGLEWGADDYISKPFEPRELVARMHALLRRDHRSRQQAQPAALAQAAQTVEFAGWRFDRVRHLLIDPSGVVLPLSSAEYRLLAALASHPNQVLSRERLLELSRAPGVDVNDRSIDLVVSRLRKKLGDTQRDGSLIRTIRGEGYLFDTSPVC